MKAFVPSNSPQTSSRIAISSRTLRAENPHDLLHRLQQLGIASVEVELSKIVDDQSEWSDAIDTLREGGVWVVSGTMAMSGEDYRRVDLAPRLTGLLAD